MKYTVKGVACITTKHFKNINSFNELAKQRQKMTNDLNLVDNKEDIALFREIGNEYKFIQEKRRELFNKKTYPIKNELPKKMNNPVHEKMRKMLFDN